MKYDEIDSEISRSLKNWVQNFEPSPKGFENIRREILASPELTVSWTTRFLKTIRIVLPSPQLVMQTQYHAYVTPFGESPMWQSRMTAIWRSVIS